MSTQERAPEARPGRGRGRGRELGLWVLCHLESHADELDEGLALFWRELPELDAGDPFFAPFAGELAELAADASARRWARRLTTAYVRDHAAIDAAIEGASKRWRLARMDRVDRNLLRLCAAELGHEDTPRNVVVSECVRLAARYGSARSIKFVNGVAEAVAQVVRDTREPE